MMENYSANLKMSSVNQLNQDSVLTCYPTQYFLLRRNSTEWKPFQEFQPISGHDQIEQLIITLIIGTDFYNNVIYSPKQNNEYHHRILHIRNSLGIEFYLIQRALIFQTKFAQIGYFWSKKNMSIAIKFCILEFPILPIKRQF